MFRICIKFVRYVQTDHLVSGIPEHLFHGGRRHDQTPVGIGPVIHIGQVVEQLPVFLLALPQRHLVTLVFIRQVFHDALIFDPGQQFRFRKGFGQVVVGAGIQSGHQIFDPVFGCQHHNAKGIRRICCPEALTHFISGHLGHHDIQQNKIELPSGFRHLIDGG